jgi:hypothetical protein
MPNLSPCRKLRATRAALLSLALVATPPALADGVGWFTNDQVNAGRWAYEQRCAVCHGQNRRRRAPAARGAQFNAQWNGKTLQQFYSYVHSQMPLGSRFAQGQDYATSSRVHPVAQRHYGRHAEADDALTDGARDGAVGRADRHGTVERGTGDADRDGALVGTVKNTVDVDADAGRARRRRRGDRQLAHTNKGYRGERYSTLSRIDATNAGGMRAVCMFQLGELGTFSTGPVVYDGILYATTHLGTYAIDATTCAKRWDYQHVAVGPEMNATNKGVAIGAGRVVRGTQDGFLLALDAKTGELLWKRQIADWRIGEDGATPTTGTGSSTSRRLAATGASRPHDGAPARGRRAGVAFDLVPTARRRIPTHGRHRQR